MSRPIVENERSARDDLGAGRRQPAWLARRHALPFQDLSDDEFEVFSYLLLLREHSGERIIYYGKTGDAGRDVVRTLPSGTVELIQCKRYTSNVGLPEIRGELAKLCTNVFRRLIPTPPGRVVFYAVPDLTAPAKDLLGNRDKWLAECEKALEEHLGEPPPADLVAFAKAWWPEFDHEDEHKLTERARAHNELIEEFFRVRHVVTGSLAELEPRLAGIERIEQSVEALRARFEEVSGGTTAATAAEPAAPEPGHVSPGAQGLQVRLLTAKVTALEERDRQHLDDAGQRLITEIQEAVRSLNFRQAVSAAARLEAWLADAGRRASASIRGRVAILLADLSLIEQTEAHGRGAGDTSAARRWYERAAEEFGAESSPEDAARLAALEAKLLSVEGNDEEALRIAAAGEDDPACLTTRLSALMDKGDFAAAVQAAADTPLHERWCDRLVIAYAVLGDTAGVERVTAAAKRRFDQTTYRRCLLGQAQGTLQRVLAAWPHVQDALPGAIPEGVASTLREVLAALRPTLTVVEANERVGTGLEAEAVACAVIATRLLGERERCAHLCELLGTREPVHVEFARAAFRGDMELPADLPGRLRHDYPGHFEARLLAALLSGAAARDDPEPALSDAEEVVRLARTETEKERAVGVLLEVAAEARDGAFERAEQIAREALGEAHRLSRFTQAARLLALKDADGAAPVVDSLRDNADPLWRQFAASLSLLRGDEVSALEHLRAASQILIRPEVLQQTALLAVKLGQHEAAGEALDRLVALRPRDARAWILLANTSVRLGRHGRTAQAFEALRRLEPDSLAYGVNHAKSLALCGRREEAVRVFDAVCERHPCSLEALGGRAHLLELLGRPDEAFRSLIAVREAFWSEPAFLLLYLSIGHRARQEEEAHLALARLLELQRQGREVPLWSLNLDELLEEFRSRRRAHEERNLEILRGRLPWLVVGRALGRPALGDWDYRTQELYAPPDDPHQRAEFTIYSTNGWAVRPDGEGGRALRRITACPPQGSPVVADLSALITLHHLGLLDRAAAHFGRILIPASYAGLALTEQGDYQPHQPSRLDAAREIRDALDRGRVNPLPAGDQSDPVPLLDEHADGPAYRLRDVVSWLHTIGRIDERRAEELTSRIPERDRAADSNLPPIAEAARRGFQTTILTLETVMSLRLFPTLAAAASLFLPADGAAEVRGRLWAAEHQERLSQEHRALWDAVQGDSRFEQAQAERGVEEGGEDRERRLGALFDAPLLASARNLPLLVDDRTFQAVVLNGYPNEPYPAFGTDCLLTALADAGAIGEEELADTFLTLARRRYRFLVPPIRVLVTLAARHRAHPPGAPLQEVSRYMHDCFRDPGLLAGFEPTEPTVSVAWESFRHWCHHVARFVAQLWHDERFEDRTARAFTAWALGELLPSPPRSLPRMGAVVLCHMVAYHVLVTALGEACRYADADRAALALREVARALGLTRAEYLEVAGDYLDLLSTHPAGTEDVEALRSVNAVIAQTALSPLGSVDARVYFALDRLGVFTEPPENSPPAELAAIRDPSHPRRLQRSPGPMVFLRPAEEGERTGEALCVPDYLLHPGRAVRETVIGYLEQAPEGPLTWLSPRSRATLAEYAQAIRSELQADWLPAARRIRDVLDEDFLLNLAGFRQCWEVNLHEEQNAYWRRVIRPGIHLAASIPGNWFEIPAGDAPATLAEICVAGAAFLSEALDRYFARYGYLPLAPPASAGSVVRRWVDAHDAGQAAWAEVWQWVDAGISPLRAYHACQVFFECPDLVPEGEGETLWGRVSRLCAMPPAGEEDTETAPDFEEVGWDLRHELARHYLGQLEIHTVEQPGDRLAALAWWAAERVASEMTGALQTVGVEVAPALRTVLDRTVSNEAALSEVEWDDLRPAGPPSPFAFGTMEARGLWVAALLAPRPVPELPLPSDYEPWVAINLLGACMGGFPPPGAAFGSGLLAFGRPFDEAAAQWAARIGTEEQRRFLEGVLQVRGELAQEGGLLSALRGVPDAEPVRQAVVCHAFRTLAALGAVNEAAVWELLSDSDWVRTFVTRAEPGPLQALSWGLLEVQRRAGDRWHWALPHLFGSLAEELDLPPERRRQLALSAVHSAAIGGGVSPVRRLLTGSRREEFGPMLDEWREQLIVIRSMGPPLAAAYLRGLAAALTR